MRLILNLLIALIVVFVSESALGNPGRGGGKKKASSAQKEPQRKLPVVAVANLKVDSTNEKVQRKIAELTDKVRDEVADSTTSCKVIDTRQMRHLKAKHQKTMASCYDDCDVEFGLLIGADFVIGGHLTPSAQSVITTLEIKDTRTRNVVSTRRIEGNNYFELENSLLSVIKRFVKPLNNIVYQAVDDEMIKDKDRVGQNNTTSPSYDPFSASSTTASSSAADANPDSDYLAPLPQVTVKEPSELEKKWMAAKEAPPLLKEQDLGFNQKSIGVFGLGIKIGYPLNVSKAKHLSELYKPIFNAGLELSARFHHLFEIAIAADFAYFTGKWTTDRRYGSPNLSDCISPDDYDELDLRNCSESGLTYFEHDFDRPAENFYRNNTYQVGSLVTVGIRPMLRLVIPMGNTEMIWGAGLGMNYMKTSGYWHTDAAGNAFTNPNDTFDAVGVSETVVYNVSISRMVFSGFFEWSLLFRLMDKKLGIGPTIEYKLPSTKKDGIKAKVDVQPEKMPTANDIEVFGYPVAEDIKESPFGHASMLNTLTLGLKVDWRF